jgi:pimeloyl-ACP methyl ester carboxylesterase
MPTIDLPIGPVDYRVAGPRTPGTPVAVFVHGFLVNATLWDPVAENWLPPGSAASCPTGPSAPTADRRTQRQTCRR